MKYFFLVLLVAALPVATRADVTASTFKVISSNCTKSSISYAQSGFAMEGVNGIVTALHGVAGCEKIKAQILVGTKGYEFRELQIVSADIERDIAIVGDVDLEGIPRLPRGQPPASMDRLSVIGFPQNIANPLEIPLEVARPANALLRDVIPSGEVAEAFAEVDSPSLSSRVLIVNGDMQVGYSGGPVLNTQSQVVGVVSGGFGKGEFGVGWTIPVADIQLSDSRYVLAAIPEIAERRSVFGKIITGEDPRSDSEKMNDFLDRFTSKDTLTYLREEFGAPESEFMEGGHFFELYSVGDDRIYGIYDKSKQERLGIVVQSYDPSTRVPMMRMSLVDADGTEVTYDSLADFTAGFLSESGCLAAEGSRDGHYSFSTADCYFGRPGSYMNFVFVFGIYFPLSGPVGDCAQRAGATFGIHVYVACAHMSEISSLVPWAVYVGKDTSVMPALMTVLSDPFN